MIRDDLSNKLIHLTRGTSREDAARNFLSIFKDQSLRGGTGCIKDCWKCVCFTEAPVSKLSTILANPTAHGSRIEPYGIMVEKSRLFERGGRPVIYQTFDEYEWLPEHLKYRHVTYDPKNGVDFTWEREWRIRADSLPFKPDDVTLVIPERTVKDGMIDNRQARISKLHDDTGVMPQEALMPYPWHFLVLSDLGVQVDMW